MKVAHSKYKNTGVLFELLVRQVTADVIDGKKNSSALSLLQKYFDPETELGKELSLYRSVLSSKTLSENKANKFVDILLSQRKKLSEKKLKEQKYNLIKEIKDNYSLEEFLSSKIPEYKVYASIYKAFVVETDQSGQFEDIDDIVNARFTITEHVMRSPVKLEAKTALLEEFKSQNEDLRLLSYRILVDKFNAKYNGLSHEQKVLLREYINNISNTNSLREYINAEVPKVKLEIKKRLPIIDDMVTKIKLREIISQLDTVCVGRTVKDSQVTGLMIAYQIVREMENEK